MKFIKAILFLIICSSLYFIPPGCGGKPTPPVVVTDTVKTDTVPAETPEHLRYCRSIETKEPSTNKRAVGLPGKYWAKTKIFKVGFPWGGTTDQIAFAKDALAEIDTMTSLTFTYPATGPYDLRIKFDPSQGAWSYVGTDCSNIPQTTQTTNIGWGWTKKRIINGKTIWDDGVARHEFIHAIGGMHEQCNPNANICWNKPVVYADLAGPPNYWPPATVDANVFYVCTGAQATSQDIYSISQYPIPVRWLGCGATTGIPGGQFFSLKDREFWGTVVYPNTIVIPPPPPPTITLTAAQVQQLMANALNTKTLADEAVLKAQAGLNAALAAKSSATNNYNNLKTALGQ